MLDSGAASLTITDDDRVHLRLIEHEGASYLQVDLIPLDRVSIVLRDDEEDLRTCHIAITDVAFDGYAEPSRPARSDTPSDR